MIYKSARIPGSLMEGTVLMNDDSENSQENCLEEYSQSLSSTQSIVLMQSPSIRFSLAHSKVC